MTQSREALAMMDSNMVTFGKPKGFVVTRWVAALYGLLFVGSIVATGLLVYHFATCGSVDSFIDNTFKDELANDTGDDTVKTTVKLSTPTPANATPKLKLNVRLPRAIKPNSYNISLVPFITEGNFTFNGEVHIVLNVTEDTENITLHAHDIKIEEDSITVKDLTSPDGGKIAVTKQSNDSARQFHILKLEKSLQSGRQYELYIKYIGNLNDILQGFYRSSYTVGNQTRWIAATQFQPTDARRAFPCFDEPALKAKFTISIARPKNMTSISNMPRDGGAKPVTDLPDYEWDHYLQSVPMSTYLVAWVVSDFHHEKEGLFSVWTREEALSQAKYSLDIGPKILTFFEQYFSITFPLPKMDMIALPDFAAGAMENWGLITYRETAMLYQQGVSTNSNKQSVATVVAHELAHQWFGNLVTPSWWTDLWLNEGFASYVEYLGVNAVEPSWKILEQFVIYDLQNVLTLDALKTSHQISIEVGHPDEINEIFDRISYGKGASIIRMMDHFLTTKVFKRGVTDYLNAHTYGSSIQNDLWDALTTQAHVNGVLDRTVTIKQIMDTWTLQTGFPVLTVTRDYAVGSAVLTQERFLLHNETTDGSSSSSLWWIPISYTSQEQPDFQTTKPSLWLEAKPSLVISQFPPGPEHWAIFNIQETGFYRVNYDPRNWELLIKHLEDESHFEQIGVINRAQLVDDALNLAKGGRLSYTTALSVTRYLTHEKEFLPWKAALTAMGYIDSMLIKTGHYDKFKLYMTNLITNLYNHVGFTDNKADDQLTVYKRVNALSWACSLGYEDCVRNCVTQFQSWRSSPDPDINNPISANLKNVVYCTAVRVGGQEEWDFAWQRYKNTNVGSEKDLLLSALGCSRETWILSRYLDWAVTENSGIRKQDTSRVFASVSNNVIGQPLAYNFLRNQWDRIRAYLGASLFTINNIVRTTTKRINTHHELDDLVKFADLHRSELGAATRAVEQAIEQAEANVKWMKRNYEMITKWLGETTSAASLDSELSTSSGDESALTDKQNSEFTV